MTLTLRHTTILNNYNGDGVAYYLTIMGVMNILFNCAATGNKYSFTSFLGGNDLIKTLTRPVILATRKHNSKGRVIGAMLLKFVFKHESARSMSHSVSHPGCHDISYIRIIMIKQVQELLRSPSGIIYYDDVTITA